MKIYRIFTGIAAAIAVISGCENQEITFQDFDYQTVYFASQYPVRTLELGEDLFVDTSLDNQRKVSIKATMGGVYTNNRDRMIDFRVDESLCEGLYFANSDVAITPMPKDYYKLASDRITIPSGSILGGVEVELTEAFFNDPKSLSNTYVIPLLMTDVQGADSILRGAPLVDNPNRCVDADWSIKPRDFVLYAVKYVNQWHGNYLRRGTDHITQSNGSTTISVRHAQYVENDEVVNISTNRLNMATLPLSIHDSGGTAINFNLVLTFSDDGVCTVSGASDIYEASGIGTFVSKGEKNSMGGYDRDALYLDYQVEFKSLDLNYATKDTLVVRDRGVAPEYFTVNKK
ncbi:MAG: DUF5627 domain-containing protein [Tannerella sp.]|jgi:hypothetical protein|nr:DUF5627 domain-containing protein [Tannerella sp.]